MAASFWGYNMPFLGGHQNVLSRQEDDRLIKNDVLQLLLTLPGERVMRPDFGVNLRNFVFEMMTDGNISLLRSEILNKLQTYEPRLTNIVITIVADPARYGLQLQIAARIKKDPNKSIIIDRFIAGIT